MLLITLIWNLWHRWLKVWIKSMGQTCFSDDINNNNNNYSVHSHWFELNSVLIWTVIQLLNDINVVTGLGKNELFIIMYYNKSLSYSKLLRNLYVICNFVIVFGFENTFGETFINIATYIGSHSHAPRAFPPVYNAFGVLLEQSSCVSRWINQSVGYAGSLWLLMGVITCNIAQRPRQRTLEPIWR